MADENKKPKKVKVEKEKKEKPALTNFLEVAPSSILSPEGQLTTHENLDEHGFDPAKHEKLGREDFANELTWLSYKMNDMRAKAVRLNKRADAIEREIKAGVNVAPEKRAAVKRVQKLASAFEALKAQLAKDGVDVDALLASAATSAAPAAE